MPSRHPHQRILQQRTHTGAFVCGEWITKLNCWRPPQNTGHPPGLCRPPGIPSKIPEHPAGLGVSLKFTKPALQKHWPTRRHASQGELIGVPTHRLRRTSRHAPHGIRDPPHSPRRARILSLAGATSGITDTTNTHSLTYPTVRTIAKGDSGPIRHFYQVQ